ncbi:hypothetical protein [Nostoc sp. CALU 546]
MFTRRGRSLLLCVVIDVVASHNTLNLELAKPNILLLLVVCQGNFAK